MSTSRRDRHRREQAEDEAERAQAEYGRTPPGHRPNRPRKPADPRLRCYGSAFGVHRFQAVNVNGEPCCAFCPLRYVDYLAQFKQAR